MYCQADAFKNLLYSLLINPKIEGWLEVDDKNVEFQTVFWQQKREGYVK